MWLTDEVLKAQCLSYHRCQLSPNKKRFYKGKWTEWNKYLWKEVQDYKDGSGLRFFTLQI